MDDGREMLKMLDLGRVSFIALETRWRSRRLKCKRGQKSFSEEAVGGGRWARDAEDARSQAGSQFIALETRWRSLRLK